MNEWRDVKRALGLGLTLIAYAAMLAWGAYAHNKRTRDETRTKLAFDNAQDRRAALVRAEGTPEAMESRS